MRIGSVCSGYEGLGAAVQAVLGGELAFTADIDPDASRLLAHRFPGVPNLGDVKAVDWSSLGTVDIFCGGFPCQPFSAAGRRLGTSDPRHLWPHLAKAIGVMHPPLVVLENVHGHLTLGFDVVLADLAALGYDAEWVVVTASAAGAPHRRARLFVLAFPAGGRRVAGVPVALIADGAWLEPCESLFGALPFAGRIPPSGRMAGGLVYACEDGPTEMASGLLKTPTAQLAVNGGSQHPDKRRAGGHGPTLADQVEHELLPTPTANVSGRTGEQHMAMRRSIGRGTPSQLEAVAQLLPTPQAADGTGGHKTRSGDRKGEPLLGGIGMLLPTPTASDFTARNATVRRMNPGSAHHDGWTLSDVIWDGELPPGADASRLLPTPAAGNFNDGESLESWEQRRRRNLAKGINGNGQGTPLAIAAQSAAGTNWGPYEAAVRRWSVVTGRPAPEPTVPGKTGRRLNPALAEWMMGLPAGWITDVPGLSRNAQLKLAGNGVVPAQAVLALTILLSRAGDRRQEAAA